MTKQELIEIVGNEEQANYTMEIILSQVKKDFVKSAINAKLSEVENKIKELESEGIIYTVNGSKHVNWNPSKDNDKQYEANSLLYTKNRLTSMIAIKQ